MKTRLITAAVAIPLLLIVLLAAPKIVAALIWAAGMSIGAYELTYRTGFVKEPRLVIYSCVMAFAMVMWSYLGAVRGYMILLLLAFMAVNFAEMMIDHVKVSFEKICICFVAGFLVPYLLGSLIRILTMSIGRYLILVPFIVAFISDSGAYFAGRYFGKHKLAPVISPNKTVEGAVGGILCAVVCMLIFGLIMDLPFERLNFHVNYLNAMAYGLFGSIAGVFGDLCFSIIKRQTGIKDYGNLIPGHGGVLDRFDSMVIVGPLMEALILLLPVIS